MRREQSAGNRQTATAAYGRRYTTVLVLQSPPGTHQVLSDTVGPAYAMFWFQYYRKADCGAGDADGPVDEGAGGGVDSRGPDSFSYRQRRLACGPHGQFRRPKGEAERPSSRCSALACSFFPFNSSTPHS